MENTKVKEDIVKNDFRAGQELTNSHTVTFVSVEMFANATGDKNPIHLDETFAQTTRFKHRIAHGMMVASYISELLGTELPGTIYMDQELHFRRPVYIGDTVTATAKITEYDKDKEVLSLDTIVTNQDGKIVIDGKAIVLVKGVRQLLSSVKRE